MTPDEEHEGLSNWRRFWFFDDPDSNIGYYTTQRMAVESWESLNTQEKMLCVTKEDGCFKVRLAYKTKLKLYILCSAVTCPRISHNSKFKKFPIDLTRKLKDFLF